MAATFSSLFRRSQFVSLRPNQVLTKQRTSVNACGAGSPSERESEYGLKHSLPASGPLSVQLLKVDSPGLKKPKLKSAWHLQTLMQTWKENFASSTPALSSEQRARLLEALKGECPSAAANYRSTQESLVTMSQLSFSHLLRDATEKRSQFMSLLSKNYLSPNEWALFLEILPLVKAPKASSLSSTLDSQLFPIPTKASGFIHPPTYASCHPTNSVMSSEVPKDNPQKTASLSSSQPLAKVKGRILNTVSGGYAVGVAGVVAFLPEMYFNFDALIKQEKRTTLPASKNASLSSTASQSSNQGLAMAGKPSSGRSIQISRDATYEFYVKSASIDSHGRPDIILSVVPPRDFSASESKFNASPFGRSFLRPFPLNSSEAFSRTSNSLAEARKAPVSSGKFPKNDRLSVLALLEKGKKL